MASLDMQFFMFLVTLLMGMATGFLADLQRVWRRLCRPGRLGQDLSDLLFLLLVGLMLLAGLLFTNWGELRLFVLLGVLSGWLLYHYLASPGISRGILWLATALAVLVGRLIGPFQALGRRLSLTLLRPARRAGSLARRGATMVRQRLAALWRRLKGFL